MPSLRVAAPSVFSAQLAAVNQLPGLPHGYVETRPASHLVAAARSDCLDSSHLRFIQKTPAVTEGRNDDVAVLETFEDVDDGTAEHTISHAGHLTWQRSLPFAHFSGWATGLHN